MSFDPETARKIAGWLNENGRSRADRGSRSVAAIFYQLASWFDRTWSVPYYNRGLLDKYAKNWEGARRLNQRAADLDPDDQDNWWNLGIAATALADWPEARRAWQACGITVPEGVGEIRIAMPAACVRLDPDGVGEVVWGQRLDPARMEVMNVPLPESQHRFHDIVLHDGAPAGTRISGSREFPVFDELMLWKASAYSTFQVNLAPSQPALERLLQICDERELGCEDWSTIRRLCSQCSRGNPGPHDCQTIKDQQHGRAAFGFAARSEAELADTLRHWSEQFSMQDVGNIQLLLAADADVGD